MKHKTTYSRMATLALAAAAMGLTMTGCEKERAGILNLVAETHQGGSKTTVDGPLVYWVDGDRVDINGTPYDISYTPGSAATVSVTANENATLLACYPASVLTSPMTESSVSVDLPAAYAYHHADGRQQVEFPMVAKGLMQEGGNLQFKHLCAAIEVKLRNDTEYPLVVRNITIESEQSQLSGQRTIPLDWNNFSVAPNTTNVADADKQVVFALDEDDCVLSVGEDVTLQIPIYPIASGDKLHFTIFTGERKIPGVLVTALYEYETAASGVTVSSTIARATVIQTPTISINPTGTGTTGGSIARVDAKFTIGSTTPGSGKQIYFSQGLLQYSKASHQWSFNSHQYAGIGAANQTSTDMIDLFCYGQTNPEASYSPVNSEVSGTNDDWGRHTGITIEWEGGQVTAVDEWRTLKWTEWKNLLYRETGITINGIPNASYMMARVKGKDDGVMHNGLVLFPDAFDPNTLSHTLSVPCSDWNAEAINTRNYKTLANGSISSTESGTLRPGVTSVDISFADWSILEAAGCVFMVADGWITKNSNGVYVHANTSDGIYWLGSKYNNTKGYDTYFNERGVPTDASDSRPEGSTLWAKQMTNKMAVRMVRDVETTD